MQIDDTDAYIRFQDIAKQIDIDRGDTLLVSSDMRHILYQCLEHGDETDLNIFLDSLQEIVGSEGTLLLPTFNWGFCQGITFDYHTTSCRTGSLGKTALKRGDFIRTKHPIYSFAVWGKDAGLLYEMENRDAFGKDSPFAYLHRMAAKNLFIDVSYQHSFTFAHYVEEWEGNVPYRYNKDFTAGYIDENGDEEQRTYSMFVRDLERNVYVTLDPMECLFIGHGAVKTYRINELIKEDILYNRSRNLCTYDGQDT